MKSFESLGWMICVGLLMSSGSAFAMGRRPTPPPVPEPSVKLGQIQAAGQGCRAGTVLIETSDDQKGIKVGFKSLSVEAVEDGQDGMDRKGCSIAVPFEAVPEGYRLVVANAKISGPFELAAGAAGQVNLEAFLVGAKGKKVEQTLAASAGVVEALLSDVLVSECGKSGLLRLVTSAQLAKSGDEHAQGLRSSIQLQELEVHLAVLKCAE